VGFSFVETDDFCKDFRGGYLTGFSGNRVFGGVRILYRSLLLTICSMRGSLKF